MHTSKFYAAAMLVGLSTSIVLAEPDNDVIEEVIVAEVDTTEAVDSDYYFYQDPDTIPCVATDTIEYIVDSTYTLQLDSAFQAGDVDAGLELSRNYGYDEDWENYSRIVSRLAAMGNARGRMLSFWDYIGHRDYDKADSLIGIIGSGKALYTDALRAYLDDTRKHYAEARAARRILAVNPSDTAANYRMGQFFFLDEIEKNVDSALIYYEKAAELGHPASAYNCGTIYFNELPDKDPGFESSKKWFTRAAELGNPDGTYCMGVLYDEGVVFPRDEKKVLDYYERAAAMNQPNANYNLGTAYLYKTYGVKDNEKAVELLTKADALGHPTAAKALGTAYSSDWFMPRDMEKAQYFLERGARKGDVDCLDWLACNSLQGREPSLEKAKEYAEQYEAIMGDQPNEFKYILLPLAEAYIDDSTELFQKAKAGDPEALDEVANFRLHNIGAYYSNEEKLEAIEKAIDAGSEYIQYDYVNLILSLKNPDYQKIIEFCEQHTGKDFSDEIDMCREALKLKKDLKQIEKDAKKGNADALYSYGRAIELGLVDGTPNSTWAKRYYIEAADRGNCNAIAMLANAPYSRNTERQQKYWQEKAGDFVAAEEAVIE